MYTILKFIKEEIIYSIKHRYWIKLSRTLVDLKIIIKPH